MNIKEHIEAGHYPTDSKGRALVPTTNGETVTICATDKPGLHPLAGWVTRGRGSDPLSDAWPADYQYFLPPTPRKVVVKYLARIAGKEKQVQCIVPAMPLDEASREYLERVQHEEYGGRLVELTGSYEEPWS